ncbi:MAG: hypothetical protein RLZZ244_2311 [Verrucomicrobiota bacterium]
MNRFFPLNPHASPEGELLALIESDALRGLRGEEARVRLQTCGFNALPEPPRRSMARVLVSQFRSPLIYLLFWASLLAWCLGKGGDAAVILVVVAINAVIGALQEGRAENSMEALRKLSGERARVCRDGVEELVEARFLVPGDVLVLEAGSAVSADARLLEASGLECLEAALTGESLPVAKSCGTLPSKTALGDRYNMVFAGTEVGAGRGRALVTATGSHTELGAIAAATAVEREGDTPLEKRLARFGRVLLAGAVGLFAMVVCLGWVRGMRGAEIFMVALSQMVSVVPEGLPVAMTIALAVGMQRMARRGVIVRRLSALETLGATQIICSDKTGTLTENQMTVEAFWLPGRGRVDAADWERDVRLQEGLPGTNPMAVHAAEDIRNLLEAGVLCNDVPWHAQSPGKRPLGDPTESALIAAAVRAGVCPEAHRVKWPRRAEIPFHSGAKLMATQHEGPGGERWVFLKGAPEVLLPLCGSAWDGMEPAGTAAQENGWALEAMSAAEAMGAESLRVLAFARVRGVLEPESGFEQFRGRAHFLGLVGQMDPPRAEARDAVLACRRAGIRAVMVTGDHRATALAVARKVGLAREGDEVLDGRELEDISDESLRARVERVAVFARVHPTQKLRIVEAFQSLGRVVVMTGDGVNDAPALARADVGVAMGTGGTEVARGVAKVVLLNNNFATLVEAIEQGRLVHTNIRKLVLFLFATSLDEVLLLLLALGLGYPLPLAAVQILWMNLVTEGTLTVNLVMEGPEGHEMDRPPVRSGAGFLDREAWVRLGGMVTASVAVTFGFFLWRLRAGLPLVLIQTETFTVLALCQWLNALSCESSTRSVFKFAVLRNRWLLAGLFLSVALHGAVIYLSPLNRLFHTVPIPWNDWLQMALIASGVLWVEELRKAMVRRRARSMARTE